MKHCVLVLALLASSGCTIVGGAAGAGITAAHNNAVEPEDDWSYVVPVVTGAVVGLVADILILRAAGKGFGSLTKQ